MCNVDQVSSERIWKKEYGSKNIWKQEYVEARIYGSKPNWIIGGKQAPKAGGCAS